MSRHPKAKKRFGGEGKNTFDVLTMNPQLAQCPKQCTGGCGRKKV